MRDPFLSRIPLRRKLPIAAAGLALLSASIIAIYGYREVQRSAHEAASRRLEGVVGQMVTLVMGQTSQLFRARMQDASHPLVRRTLEAGQPLGFPDSALRAVLVPDASFLDASLWRPDGVKITTTGTRAVFDTVSWATLSSFRSHPDSIAVTPMWALGDTLVYGFIVPVFEQGRRVGDLVQWRRRTPTPQVIDQISRLLGSEAVLYIGSFGGAWTDQARIVDAPPDDARDTSQYVTYARDGIGGRVARAGNVPGTPWTMLVEFSDSIIHAPVQTFQRRVGLLVVLIGSLAVFYAWALGKHVADPLDELTGAARLMGSGHESVRVDIGGADELSTLGTAFNDMAQRVTDEAAAREQSEEQWRLLFMGNPHPMWVFDVETLRFLAVNDAAIDQYGYTRDEFLAMSIAEIRPDADRAGLPALVASRPARSISPMIHRHLRKDGSVVEVEVHSHAVQFAGRASRLVLAHDVTSRVALEMQLRHSQKMDAVGRLAGGVAHDFNNLLAVIIAHVEMLQADTPVTDPRTESLQEVHAAADRARRLTRQLLTFSRQQPVSLSTLAVNDTLRSIARMLRPILTEEIEVVLNLGEMRDGIRVDAGQFEQVLVNMAVNARDAMPRGGTLTFCTAARDIDEESMTLYGLPTTGRYVVISVSDTGTGMDATTLGRVFEPFFTTKAPGKGTGLGLATAYGIVAQAGGHITVYSELGLGTTFRIYLPSHTAEDSRASRAAADAPGGNETLLVVEDDPAVRTAVVAMTRRLGYAVVTADTGAVALSIARDPDAQVDILVTDIVMPGMDGPTLAAAFREIRPGTKVLLMSGYAGDILAGRADDTGTLPMIQKPFTRADFARKLREVLDS